MSRHACVVALLLAGLAACAGPSARIKAHQEAFDAYPPATQEAIRAGRVELGMTPEMVQLAAGNPDHKYASTTQNGEQETWTWGAGRAGVGFGFGFSTWGPGVMGGTVAVEPGAGAYDDRLRVTFKNGAVSAVERRK